MKKLNKIFSVLLTAALLTGMLVSTALPVAADTQDWSEISIPSGTNEVMANDIVDSGLLTKSIDGTLFAYVDDGVSRLAKSTDGGKKWTYVSAPVDAAITAIAVSPTEANVVYIAIGGTVYKSMDAGATFATMATVPVLGGGYINTMDVAKAGGSYKVIVGTTGGGASNNIWLMDEANFFYSFETIGTPNIQTATPNTQNVIALALSPNFETDRTIVAVTTETGGAGVVNVAFNVNGGSWLSAIDMVTVDFALATYGDIAFPEGFDTFSNNIFFVAFNDTSGAGGSGGVYRIHGSTTTSTATELPTSPNAAGSIDVIGNYLTGTIVVGTVDFGAYDGEVWTSVGDGGADFNQGANLPGTGTTTVVIGDDGNFFALQAVTAGADDESGFSVSMDQGANFAQISLLNSTIASIDDVVFAPNGDIYMATSSVTAGTGNDSLWRQNANGWQRIQSDLADGTLNMLKLSPNYVTDGGVFYVDANVIQKSANFGKTFATTVGSPGTVNDYVVVDLNTFVVAAGASGIQRTANNGFIWTSVSDLDAVMLAISSNGTALAAAATTGETAFSADLGATFTSGGNVAGDLFANLEAIAFEQGSTTKIWGISNDDPAVLKSKTGTADWSANMIDVDGLFDSTSDLDTGVGVVTGIAPSGEFVVYALDNDGNVARKQSKTGASGFIAADGFTAGAQLFIKPMMGANQLLVNTGTELWTYTDTLAVAMTGGAASNVVTGAPGFLGLFPAQSSATISWDELDNATDYTYEVTTGSAETDVYESTTGATDETSANLTGLTPDTVYYVTVWAVAPVASFGQSFSFSTPPTTPSTPIDLAPEAGAAEVPVRPSFQWSMVPNATSYTVEVATDATFTTIVRTLTTPIAAVAWSGADLDNNTVYYWRVTATTPTGTSAAVESVFTTLEADAPPVTVTTTTSPNITLTQLPAPDQETPGYIWIIIAIGGILTVLVIVLIVRTRRVV